MSNGVNGKVVLILGGAGGIGSAAARDLAAKGARIAIADIGDARQAALAQELTDHHVDIRSYRVDVVDQAQVRAVVEAVSRDFGRIDVLIDAAGTMLIRSITEIDTAEWEVTIDLNVKGTMWGVAAVLPVFLAQQSGHIINLGAVHGMKVFSSGAAIHSASKSAVRAFSEGLRAELVHTPIRVTTVTPGAVDTEIQHRASGADSRMHEMSRNAIPASAVARAIAFAIEQPANIDVNEIVIRPTTAAIVCETVERVTRF